MFKGEKLQNYTNKSYGSCALHIVQWFLIFVWSFKKISLTVFMSSTDMILSQNCFLQVQRRITKKKKYSRVMVVVLCTSSYDAYSNTCMKFYEHNLKGFKALERTYLSQKLVCTYKVQRDVTQRVSIQELRFLHSACRLMFVNICL